MVAPRILVLQRWIGSAQDFACSSPSTKFITPQQFGQYDAGAKP
jgi:hypothetical protein